MKRRTRGRKRGGGGGAGRTLMTLCLLLLITFFGVSIYLGRAETSRDSNGPVKPRPASLDLPAPAHDIVPDAASPTLVIWNGCGRPGLGAKVGRWMRRSGFDVFETTNADRSDYGQTLVVIRSSHEEAANRIAAFLKRQLGVGQVIRQRAKIPEADVLLILGSDFPDTLPAFGVGLTSPER